MTNIKLHQKAIIFNDEGKILALKASYKWLKWDLPGGGLEFPELHEEALRREIREETSLEIQNIVPLEIQSVYNKEADEYMIFIGYKCWVLSGSIKLSSEHSEYRWVTKDQFLTLDAIPYLKDYVAKFC